MFQNNIIHSWRIRIITLCTPSHIILGVGLIFAIICSNPYFFLHSPELITYSLNSTIVNAIKSEEYKNISMLCIGISIPLVLDYIFDFISYAVRQKNYAFLGRAMILCSLLLPNIIILVYIIPHEKFEYLGCISSARILIYFMAAFLHLISVGGDHFRSKIFYALYIIAVTHFTLGAFRSVTASVSCNLAANVSAFVLFLFLFLVIYQHGASLRKTKRGELTDVQLSCSAYLCCIFFVAFIKNITVLIWGFDMTDETSFVTLVLHEIVFTVLVLTISIVHGRITRAEMTRTEQTLERKRVFVRLVSHEIRTPLNIVVQGLKLLHKEMSKNEIDKNLSEIVSDTQASCDIAVTLLDDLLAYEKLEAGVMVLEKTSVRTMMFLKDAAKPFLIQARQAGVHLYFSDERELNHLFRHSLLICDKNKLNQVLRNLVSNGLKFTPAGGSVVISACIMSSSNVLIADESQMDDNEEKFIRIDVKDTGAGISKENQIKLFDNIIQFHAGKLQMGGGSGLGLWLSKSIVNLHDGKIYVNSDGEGKGCTFSVELPLVSRDSVSTWMPEEERPDETLTIRALGGLMKRMSSKKLGSTSSSKRIIRQRSSRRNVFDQKENDENEPLSNTSRGSLSMMMDRFSSAPFFFGSSNPLTRCNSDRLLRVNSRKGKLQRAFSFRVKVHEKCENNYVDGTESEDSVVLHALMVDDSAMARKMLRRVVAEKFATIKEAEDGEVAVSMVIQAMAREAPLDIIFMDYQMPKMDGPTATKAIRGLGFTGLILGVTGNALPEDIANFIAHGADQVLTKPFDIEVLESIFLNVKAKTARRPKQKKRPRIAGSRPLSVHSVGSPSQERLSSHSSPLSPGYMSSPSSPGAHIDDASSTHNSVRSNNVRQSSHLVGTVKEKDCHSFR